MWSYWRSVWSNARARFADRLKGWRAGIVGFAVQTALLFVLLLYVPWFGAINEKAPYIFAGALAVVLRSLFSLLIDLIRTPAEMHAKLMETLNEQAKRLAELEEDARPRLKVEKLVRKPPDDKYYLLVRNQSGVAALTDCLARIESLTDDQGTEILSYVPLRTENQVDGRPEGRFNLDPNQAKRVVLCEPVSSGSFLHRIIGAQPFSKKLPSGNYRMHVRLSTSMGGAPHDVMIAIVGSRIMLEG